MANELVKTEDGMSRRSIEDMIIKEDTSAMKKLFLSHTGGTLAGVGYIIFCLDDFYGSHSDLGVIAGLTVNLCVNLYLPKIFNYVQRKCTGGNSQYQLTSTAAYSLAPEPSLEAKIEETPKLAENNSSNGQLSPYIMTDEEYINAHL